MKIGNVLTNGIALAPLAGITDMPFRLICRMCGAGLAFTEMVSAKGIIYNNANTKNLLTTSETEHPIGVQLFGNEPDVIAEAIAQIEKYPFDIIDLNMGCPVPKVVKNGEGSALMKNPELIGQIVKKAVSATKKPVTIKIRKGFNENTVNAVEVAKIAECSGASAITVHGRTREQYYSGKADWNIIAAVKKAVKIPVISNGDIFNELDAKKIFDQTECDGIMIARGALGNPWIFSGIESYLGSGTTQEPPSLEQKIKLALKHTKMQVEYKSEYIGIREMRKHICWYIKGIPNSSAIRLEINKAETLDEVKNIFNMLGVYTNEKSI